MAGVFITVFDSGVLSVMNKEIMNICDTYFNLFILNNLYTQFGTHTCDMKIKSHMLF